LLKSERHRVEPIARAGVAPFMMNESPLMQHVASLSALTQATPKTVEIGGTKILLIRDGDAVRGFSATCPHAGAPLDKAAVCEGKLICPWHKAMFDLTDGALLEPPALDPLRRYPVRVEGNNVFASPEPIVDAPTPAVPEDARTMAIVGAGAAGVAGACALREFGFAGRIVLIGAEPGAPYDRTALSKAVLQGKTAPDEAPALRPVEFWSEHRIERLHDRVDRLDPSASKLSLAGGSDLSYDAVLLASGGTARRLDVPGATRPGVHQLRTREDAAAILNGALKDPRGKPGVVIVGGGFIGLEAASALRSQDLAVEVVIQHPLPLASILGEAVAARLKALHEENGVVFRIGTVAKIEGEGEDENEGEQGPVTGVVLEDGSRIAAGLVLTGIGVTPATRFAQALDLAEDGGLDTDRSMRVAGRVFAAGDIARFPFGDDERNHIRVEHWRVAQQQARVAAACMLGLEAQFDQPPLFWTLQHGKRFEVQGHPDGFDRVEIDGDLAALDFVARQYRGDALVGLVGCGRDTAMAALSLTLPSRP
jgi:NADPH-dependent 2,4-dienoyl-CoA reductase/sulfur reductase-like enzyme/nitrite reductase/ring-hydroxylating ferredoxin subunit